MGHVWQSWKGQSLCYLAHKQQGNRTPNSWPRQSMYYQWQHSSHQTEINQTWWSFLIPLSTLKKIHLCVTGIVIILFAVFVLNNVPLHEPKEAPATEERVSIKMNGDKNPKLKFLNTMFDINLSSISHLERWKRKKNCKTIGFLSQELRLQYSLMTTSISAAETSTRSFSIINYHMFSNLTSGLCKTVFS